MEYRVLVLGIDTSSFAIGMGLVNDEKVVFDLLINSGIPQSESIVDIMNEWLIDFRTIDGFGVSLGPGSFTSLRIGLATTKGLAIGFNKPIVGIPTLDTFVRGITYPKYNITPILDAKSGKVYTATYSPNGKRISPYIVTNMDEFLQELKGEHILVGSGVEARRDLIKKRLGNRAHLISPNPDSPRGTWVASIALERLRNGDFDKVDSLEPMYLGTKGTHIKSEVQNPNK